MDYTSTDTSRRLTTPASTSQRSTDEARARALLQGAFAQQYTFPRRFSGFRADIVVQNNDRKCSGKIIAHASHNIDVLLDDADMQRLVRREIQSFLLWHQYLPVNQRIGPYPLVLDNTPHPLGVCITLHGERLETHYRVQNDSITERYRGTAPESTTTQILDHHQVPDGRLLPRYSITFFCKQGSGRLVQSEARIDEHIDIQGVWLPTLRQVSIVASGTMTAYSIRLNCHWLM
ncbi:MAG: DUF3386 family protein [Chloroflexota bacterium]